MQINPQHFTEDTALPAVLNAHGRVTANAMIRNAAGSADLDGANFYANPSGSGIDPDVSGRAVLSGARFGGFNPSAHPA